MPPTNDFVPFCNENTGTNLPTQSDYLANPALPIGNQPGIASSSLNNKAIRQGTTIAAVLAQFICDTTNTDVLDAQNTANHAIPTALEAQTVAAFKRQSPVITAHTSSSGTHNLTYKFQIASGNATAAATYSDGTTTYTVSTTIAAATQLNATGAAAPVASGTLTKLSGTGDATITFYAVRAPLYLKVKMVGGGGGGGGAGTGSPGTGGTGGNTTFGTALLTANGGTGGAGSAAGHGTGGTATGGNINITGANGGQGSSSNLTQQGAAGGNSAFGGAAGTNQAGGNAGDAATTNSGSGGGGASSTTATNGQGSGGGAGGYCEAVLTTVLSTYAWAVGAAGTAGATGTGGAAGGVGGSGIILVEEHYQ